MLLRQLSSNPTTPPANNRKGAMRAVKGNLGGTSPHSIQRRRTTASHTGRAIHAGAPEHFYQRRRHHESGYASHELLRPVSWHPNSRSFDTTAGYGPTSEPALRNTIAGLQNLAVTTVGAAGGESPLPTPLPAGSNYAVHPASTTTVHPAGGFHDGQMATIDPTMAYVSQPVYAWPSQYQGYFSEMPPSYDPAYYPPVTEMPPLAWSQTSHFPAPAVPSLVPDCLSFPASSEDPDSLTASGASPLPRKRSKELVGMGLYDNPEDDLWSELDHDHPSFLYHLANPHRESRGKGLKLEETWEPPKGPDGADEDEAYSSDEAEEELPVVATSMEQGPPTCYGPYGDLSNQSFFFDSDDPYSACVMFDQGLQPFPPKCPEPARENFLWC